MAKGKKLSRHHPILEQEEFQQDEALDLDLDAQEQLKKKMQRIAEADAILQAKQRDVALELKAMEEKEELAKMQAAIAATEIHEEKLAQQKIQQKEIQAQEEKKKATIAIPVEVASIPEEIAEIKEVLQEKITKQEAATQQAIENQEMGIVLYNERQLEIMRTLLEHQEMQEDEGLASNPVKDRRTALDILGITTDNTDIRTAELSFRKLARIHHPDRGGDPEKFRQLNNAIAFLRSSRANLLPSIPDEEYNSTKRFRQSSTKFRYQNYTDQQSQGTAYTQKLPDEHRAALKTLGITTANTDLRTANTAYKKLALIHHPDKSGGNIAEFRRINQAIEYLREHSSDLLATPSESSGIKLSKVDDTGTGAQYKPGGASAK